MIYEFDKQDTRKIENILEEQVIFSIDDYAGEYNVPFELEIEITGNNDELYVLLLKGSYVTILKEYGNGITTPRETETVSSGLYIETYEVIDEYGEDISDDTNIEDIVEYLEDIYTIN